VYQATSGKGGSKKRPPSDQEEEKVQKGLQGTPTYWEAARGKI